MRRFTKCIAGAVTGFGGSLITAASDGTVEPVEWLVVLGTTLVTGAAVYFPSNKVTA